MSIRAANITDCGPLHGTSCRQVVSVNSFFSLWLSCKTSMRSGWSFGRVGGTAGAAGAARKEDAGCPSSGTQIVALTAARLAHRSTEPSAPSFCRAVHPRYERSHICVRTVRITSVRVLNFDWETAAQSLSSSRNLDIELKLDVVCSFKRMKLLSK